LISNTLEKQDFYFYFVMLCILIANHIIGFFPSLLTNILYAKQVLAPLKSDRHIRAIQIRLLFFLLFFYYY